SRSRAPRKLDRSTTAGWRRSSLLSRGANTCCSCAGAVDRRAFASSFTEEVMAMETRQYNEELRRVGRAALIGLAATAAMTLLMTFGLLRHAPVALRPFPVEFALRLFPTWAPLPLAVATTLAHFAYGAAAAA